MTMDNYSGIKHLYVLFLKYSPTIGVFCLMVHYALLPFGVRTILPDYIVDLSLLAYIFLMISSWLFGFCRLHRAFITYIAAGSLDIDLHHWFSMGLIPAPFIPALMCAAGVVLFILLIRRILIRRRCPELG